MVKIGDKVRYLNAVGGGVISKIQKNLVYVLESDGFETPVLANEVVVVNTVNQYNFPTEDKTIPEQVIENEPVQETPVYEFDELEETKEGEALSVYLALVPDDLKQMQTTKTECYLVNSSNYYLSFNFFRGEDELELKENGVVEPQTKLWLETVEKEDVNAFTSIRFQAIAYKKNKSFTVKPVIDTVLTIDPTKFYKLHSFTENDYFDKKAWLLPIIENYGVAEDYRIVEAELKSALAQKERVEPKKRFPAKVNKNTVIEVDLHINQLVNSTVGMSNFDMLQVQLGKFNEVMRANLKKRGQKIVFIHGKGEGVLRKEIEKVLKTSYRTCYFQDASFQQYGFGATQVTIR